MIKRAHVGALVLLSALIPGITRAQQSPPVETLIESASVAEADLSGMNHRGLLELAFTPTGRAQVAVWVETADGQFVDTLALTGAVADAGIGNRPGAMQMNSGYRWPYGRREGALPVWAHRRAAAPGAKLFRRVIFQDRRSEGFASRTAYDMSRDDYYCLSFKRETTGRDALDAVSCASIFSSDKGRFITEEDVEGGYAEPYETTSGQATMRPLDLWSLYPPRRDVRKCQGGISCFDHPDIDRYAQHAAEVMPRLDAISRATPAGEEPQKWVFTVPSDWDDGDYRVFVEVHVEGDYNGSFNPDMLPTPSQPESHWDPWALGYGYPYRGQPSVVYSLPFQLGRDAGVTKRGVGCVGRDERESWTSCAEGHGRLEGENGTLLDMGEQMTDNPVDAPGSGADRLRLQEDGTRLRARILDTNPCLTSNPPPECGQGCINDAECGGLSCMAGECASLCSVFSPPGEVQNLRVSPHPDPYRAHTWARLHFEVPGSERPIGAFDVMVSDGRRSWPAQTPDREQELLPVALNVCADARATDGADCEALRPGSVIEVDVAGLNPESSYTLTVTARDSECGQMGPVAHASFETSEIVFTTVTPCFIATAAYGSPLASQIGVLRNFRDRYLLPTGPGRALVQAYYTHGPTAAHWLREHPTFRRTVRVVLEPLVNLLRWWM